MQRMKVEIPMEDAQHERLAKLAAVMGVDEKRLLQMVICTGAEDWLEQRITLWERGIRAYVEHTMS